MLYSHHHSLVREVFGTPNPIFFFNLFQQCSTAFASTNFSCPSLNVFRILFFWILRKWNCSFPSWIINSWRMETMDLSMLILYAATLLSSFLSSTASLWILWDFLSITTCHLQIRLVLLLFKVWTPLILFFPWWLWLEIPVHCWIAMSTAGIFAFFLLLGGNTFYHWVLC